MVRILQLGKTSLDTSQNASNRRWVVALESLEDLYVEELKDLYSAEKQLVRALPKMRKAATNDELAQAFADHLEQTEEHVTRLEQIFDNLGRSPRGKKCKGMEGLLEEGKDVMHEDGEDDVIDAALISAAQRVEHYEMAGYGSVRTYALQLGYDDQARILQQTLDEEGAADKLLTQLAEGRINLDADNGGDSEEEGDRPSRSRRR
jgi:ferritin-like metal-binding protein YciE